MNNLNEKLKNSDYKRFIELIESKDPVYSFIGISACRGLSKENPTKKEIDDNNGRNKKNTDLLEHEINAAGFPFLEMDGVYEEYDAGMVYERSFLVYSVNEDKLREVMTLLGKAFRQDSLLFIKEKKASYIWTGEGEQPDWSKGTFNVDASQNSLEAMFSRFCSRKSGRRFQIKTIQEKSFANNFMTKLMYYTSDDIIKLNRLDEEGYRDSFVERIREYIEK